MLQLPCQDLYISGFLTQAGVHKKLRLQFVIETCLNIMSGVQCSSVHEARDDRRKHEPMIHGRSQLITGTLYSTW